MAEMNLPEGWVETVLGSVVRVSSGVGFPIKYQGKKDGQYPVYKVGDISQAVLKNSGYLDFSNNYVTLDEAKELKGEIYKEGTVLFAKIGEAVKLNRRAVVRKEGLADNNVMAVISEIHHKFVYYFMNTVDLTDVSRSTTVPSIRKGDIETIDLFLPPLAEQKVIADQLDSLLAQVERTKTRLERIPTLMKQFRQSVLADAVSGKLTEGWRLNSEFSFSETELGQLARFIDYRGKTPQKTSSGIPLITAKNIRQGFISREPREFIAENDYDSWMTRGIPNFGDVLITTEAPMGYVANIDINERFALAQRAICLQFVSVVNPYYATIFMQTSSFQRALEECSTGSTVKGIKAALLKKIKIKYPSLPEQTEIVRRVEILFAHADSIEQQAKAGLERVNQLTQSILAKAFRGELTTQWRQDHPELISGENSAEALLERIKAERTEMGGKKRGIKNA
jgi:type I restriction enzyme S subunit